MTEVRPIPSRFTVRSSTTTDRVPSRTPCRARSGRTLGRWGGCRRRTRRHRAENDMKIGVVGTGAMGAVYAALLGKAGHEVWAIDIWSEHLDAIATGGLRVSGASGSYVVHD